MKNDATTARRMRGALPSLVLGLMVAAFLLVSGARAEDAPIVSVGPVASGGNTASCSVGQGGKTTTCVNDEKSEANPSTSDPEGSAQLNQGSCQAAAAGSLAATGTGGSTGSTSSTGSGGSTAGSGAKSSGAAAAWVSAGQAAGLRIVRVRHLTKDVSVTKHFRVLATLRDTRGRLVRGAIVSVSRAPGAQNTISGVHATFSNKVGQATISVPVAKHMLGKRLYLKIAARTPTARALTLRSVRLPV
jgi:hypothetical protein